MSSQKPKSVLPPKKGRRKILVSIKGIPKDACVLKTLCVVINALDYKGKIFLLAPNGEIVTRSKNLEFALCHLLYSYPFQFNRYVLSTYYSFNKYLLRAYHMVYNEKKSWEIMGWALQDVKKKNDIENKNAKYSL